PVTSTLFPYTTLFRSRSIGRQHESRDGRRRDGGFAAGLDVGEGHQHVPVRQPVRGRREGKEVISGGQQLLGAERAVRSNGPAVRSEEHTSELQSRENL